MSSTVFFLPPKYGQSSQNSLVTKKMALPQYTIPSTCSASSIVCRTRYHKPRVQQHMPALLDSRRNDQNKCDGYMSCLHQTSPHAARNKAQQHKHFLQRAYRNLPPSPPSPSNSDTPAYPRAAAWAAWFLWAMPYIFFSPVFNSFPLSDTKMSGDDVEQGKTRAVRGLGPSVSH